MYARQITSEETYTLAEAKRIINAERKAKSSTEKLYLKTAWLVFMRWAHRQAAWRSRMRR